MFDRIHESITPSKTGLNFCFLRIYFWMPNSKISLFMCISANVTILAYDNIEFFGKYRTISGCDERETKQKTKTSMWSMKNSREMFAQMKNAFQPMVYSRSDFVNFKIITLFPVRYSCAGWESGCKRNWMNFAWQFN